MRYTVKYKKASRFSFWKTIKNVEADGVLIDTFAGVKNVFPYRWFLLEDKTRIEIPMENMMFEFDPIRFSIIKTDMDAKAGQVIPIAK